MNQNMHVSVLLLILCILLQPVFTAKKRGINKSEEKYVDVLVGTAESNYLLARSRPHAWNEALGNTAPLIGRPFGMTHWTVETQRSSYKCISPYYDTDKIVTGIRATNWLSGSCAQDYGSVTLLPI